MEYAWHDSIGDAQMKLKPIFLGNGDYSTLEVDRLHDVLDYAVSILSGLQQPGHPENKEQADQEEACYKEHEEKLRSSLKTLIAGFGYLPEELI